jgi:acyl-CoA synthetase (AMP-forming)/AMP-acid ligase II
VTGETWSFREIIAQSSKLARVLHGAGIRQNDVVSIISENRYEFTAISFGTILLNGIVAPINTTYTERKLALPSITYLSLCALRIKISAYGVEIVRRWWWSNIAGI